MKPMTGTGRFAAFLTAALMALMLTLAPAQADWLGDMLAGYGLDSGDVQAFSKLVSDMGDSLSAEDTQALLQEFLGDSQAQKIPGALVGSQYTSPQGFVFTVPEGWTLLEDQVGIATVLAGEADDSGFMPTISVVVLAEEQPDFAKTTRAEWDALLGESLANYLFIDLDEFLYLDVTAHEFVCMHGEREDAMFKQYQLYFNKEGKAYIITMTTLAEESAHDDALAAYDSFIAGFTVSNDGLG